MKSQNVSHLADTAQVDSASVQPFPNSKKIYVQGTREDIRVPMREISLSPTVSGTEENPQFEPNAPVRVYDTSGPYSDPNVAIDIRKGLPSVRSAWIEERGDTEFLAEVSSPYTRERMQNAELAKLRFDLQSKPRRAKPGKNVTQLHYAKQGIITPEMEYVAIRENMALAQMAKEQGIMAHQHAGQSFSTLR